MVSVGNGNRKGGMAKAADVVPGLLFVGIVAVAMVSASPVPGGVDPAVTVTGPDGRVRAGPPVTDSYTGQGLLPHPNTPSDRLRRLDEGLPAEPEGKEAPEDVHARQMQPAGHDNFLHAMINFFSHEILYVENDLVLVWHPETGKWSIHSLNRGCGSDCPLLTERPVSSGEWPDMAYHKLTFLGCHPETMHSHLLDVDPKTGEYKIWLFDARHPTEPLRHLAAVHRRLELTEFGVTYVSKDEILLHEGRNYRSYIVEPRLPLRETRHEDPIGPFYPLDMGEFRFKEQVVYVGDRRLMDYSSTTGQYSVYLYDRGAVGDEPPVTHLVSEGRIAKGRQLTAVGHGQVLMLDPMSGDYKVLDISETLEGGFDSAFLRPFGKKDGGYYGHGSVVKTDQCAHEKACGGCIAKDGCGWCETTGQCFRGNANGPCTTNCSTWQLSLCPAEPCSAHRGCSDCVADPFCGFCADTKMCTEGTIDGPLFGACDYHKLECPIAKGPAEVVCEDDIKDT